MVSAKDFDAPEWNTKVLLGTPLLFPPKPILPPLFFSPVIYGKYVTLYRICVIPPGYFHLRHLNDVDKFLLYTQNTRKSNAAAIYLFSFFFEIKSLLLMRLAEATYVSHQVGVRKSWGARLIEHGKPHLRYRFTSVHIHHSHETCQIFFFFAHILPVRNKSFYPRLHYYYWPV
jgi:hypothetical protein